MTKRRVALLSDAFYTRLFENEFFSSPVSASGATAWLLAIVATPGVMISASQLYFFAHARTFAPEQLQRIVIVGQSLHVAFAMAVAGLLTMLVWTSLSPDRRDALVLGPLPVATRELAVARLHSLCRFFFAFAVALSLPAAVIFTFVTAGDEAPMASVVAHIIGHAVATFAGAAFVFFTFVGVQVALAALWGPPAVAVAAVPLQVAALVGLVATFAYTPALADALVRQTADAGALALNPAAWFVGLYRWIAGSAEPVYGELAIRAAAATISAAGATLLVHPTAYARCQLGAVLGRPPRSSTGRRPVSRGLSALLGLMARSPLERGLTHFIVSSLSRSHGHRFVIGSYAAVGLLFALPLAGRLAGTADAPLDRYAWFAVPLGMVWWSAAGVRVAMMLPVEPRANWVFRLTEPLDKWSLLSTITRVVSTLTVVPIGLVAAVGAGTAAGPAFGAAVGAVVMAAGLVLAEGLTFTMHAVPCTGTYRPGQLRLRLLWPVYGLAWVGTSNLLPRLAAAVSHDAGRMTGLVLLLLACTWGLRSVRRLRMRGRGELLFEPVETGVTKLAIGG